MQEEGGEKQKNMPADGDTNRNPSPSGRIACEYCHTELKHSLRLLREEDPSWRWLQRRNQSLRSQVAAASKRESRLLGQITAQDAAASKRESQLLGQITNQDGGTNTRGTSDHDTGPEDSTSSDTDDDIPLFVLQAELERRQRARQ
jgi:hypothetical protein